MEVFESIHNRRSVRKYKEKDVEDEKLKNVLEAARWAPSWANTQCFRFIVIENNERKEKIADTLGKNNPARNAVKNAPIVIVSCAEKEISGYKSGQPVTDKGDWFMFDVGLAMENLMLAAYSEGLGTVQVGAFDAEQVEEILDVPSNASVVTITPLGYPSEEPKKPSRKKLGEIVFGERYGNKLQI